ncbi:hypothetical protein O6H91_06G107300 [Diphasiastrum complanatum]|uniref:Uncharacterized protein n=1 Tax=Diphasiastrum complanatum TaxID=34168 RepID=A0ACC2DHE8_DIPCM|nr:hypothetical protein O6H91_Y400000 [Diphasiastrum complanatum]KAJ7553653.1 hypothetical protein O6H91_06G107300 [Diphasiastrum complanatum]
MACSPHLRDTAVGNKTRAKTWCHISKAILLGTANPWDISNAIKHPHSKCILLIFPFCYISNLQFFYAFCSKTPKGIKRAPNLLNGPNKPKTLKNKLSRPCQIRPSKKTFNATLTTPMVVIESMMMTRKKLDNLIITKLGYELSLQYELDLF